MMKELKQKIEDVLEVNGSDFQISKAFKEYIQRYNISLKKTFEESQGKDFLVKHTKAYDSIIILMYNTLLRRMFRYYLPMKNSIPISIIALGSYGREQLSVHSDIDLMIVYEKIDAYNTDTIIEKLLYLAWDAGLKLGHRVHDCKDILKASREDITIKTAMLESRFIVGSKLTWHTTQRELEKIRKDNPKEFITQKIEEAHIRRKKYPISMQPNIKESIGGLRDAHLLFWISNIIYGVENTKELCGIIYTVEEYRDYRIALELLYRVRNALHLMADKQLDFIHLEDLPTLSTMLGFKTPNHLASKILESHWRVDQFTQIFITKMIRPLFIAESSIDEIKKGRIEKNLFCFNNRFYTSFKIDTNNIFQLLKKLNNLEDKVWRFDPSVIYLFSKADISQPLTQNVYKELRTLLQREHTHPFLMLFYEAGILQGLFSAFRKVMFMPQFDGYHQLPVDLHSIECIKALENIQDNSIKELYDSLHADDKLILKVATLLHDSGKGRNLDHSEVGMKLVNAFAKELNIDEKSRERAALLVKHHTLMTTIAYKANIYNEKVIYKFMSQIQNSYNLKLLYILTYADVNGVGNGIYSSNTARLLKEVYELGLEASTQNNRINEASRRLKIEKRIENLETFKTLSRSMQKKLLGIESNLFFFKHTPSDIVSIANYAKDIKRYNYIITNEDHLSVQIFRKVDFNLSFFLASLSFLDVATMEVFTLFDNIKYFKIVFLEKVYAENIAQIEQITELSFDMSQNIQTSKPHIKESEITLDCEHSKQYAELNINTKNQKGLLAFIVSVFDLLNINIVTAKINSTKTKVRDHFLIEKDPLLCNSREKLREYLTQSCDN